MRRKQHVRVQLLPIIKEDHISISKELGKYLLDISKLIIGGAMVTTALDLTSDKIIVINIAIGAALIFAGIGLTILYKTFKRKDNKL